MISGIGVDLVDKARFINLVKKFGRAYNEKIYFPKLSLIEKLSINRFSSSNEGSYNL